MGDPRTYEIIGAAMEVHRELGSGFLENVYHDAMEVEFGSRGIPFKREVSAPVMYKGQQLGAPYRIDFVCYGAVIVELKALGRISSKEESQVIHYLKATRVELGLLLNFGAGSLEYKRLVRSN